MSEVTSAKKKIGDVYLEPAKFYWRTNNVKERVKKYKASVSAGKPDCSVFKDVVRIKLSGPGYAFLTEDELKNYKKLTKDDFKESDRGNGTMSWLEGGTLGSLKVDEKVDDTKADAIGHISNLVLKFKGTQ